MKPMPDTKVKRNRPKVSLTVSKINLEWFDAFRGGTSRSRAFDAVLGAFRSYVADVAEIASDPRVDFLRRSEAVLRATRAGEVPDLEDVEGLISGLLREEAVG